MELFQASHINMGDMNSCILFLRISAQGKSHFVGVSNTCFPGSLSLQNLAPRPLVLTFWLVWLEVH